MSSIILIRRSKGLTNFGLPKTVHTRRTSKPPSKRNMPPYSFRFSPSYSLLPHPSSFISPLYPNYPPVGPTRHPPFHLSPSLPVPTNPPPVPSATVQGSQPPRPLFLHRGAGWGSGAGAGTGEPDRPKSWPPRGEAGLHHGGRRSGRGAEASKADLARWEASLLAARPGWRGGRRAWAQIDRPAPSSLPAGWSSSSEWRWRHGRRVLQ
jgi:hypothetical protein